MWAMAFCSGRGGNGILSLLRFVLETPNTEIPVEILLSCLLISGCLRTYALNPSETFFSSALATKV